MPRMHIMHFKETPIVDLDDKKVLVISDIHLNSRFDPGKADALNRLIDQAEVIVLNGDIVDGYRNDWPDIAGSEWKKLFITLKNKTTFYLFGNHDPESFVQEGTFSSFQSNKFALKTFGQVYYFEHGDRLAPTVDKRLVIPRKIRNLGNVFEGIMVKIIGKKYLKIYAKGNRKMLNWKKTNLPKDYWLICGHTHCQEVNENAKFADSGLFNWGYGQYLLINRSGIQAKEIAY